MNYTRSEIEEIRNRVRTAIDPDEMLALFSYLDETEQLLTRAYSWIPDFAAGLRFDIRVHMNWTKEEAPE